MVQKRRQNSTLLLLCKAEKGWWELWERADEAAAADEASPSLGTLTATLAAGVRAADPQREDPHRSGPQLYASSSLTPGPGLHTWPVFSGQLLKEVRRDHWESQGVVGGS